MIQRARNSQHRSLNFVWNGRHRVLLLPTETRAPAVGFKKAGDFGNFPRRYYPDRVRGYFSAPLSEHPCFNNLIETLPLMRLQIGSSFGFCLLPQRAATSWTIALQRRHREARDFSRIVRAPQPDRFAARAASARYSSACAAVIGPPCSARLSTDDGERAFMYFSAPRSTDNALPPRACGLDQEPRPANARPAPQLPSSSCRVSSPRWAASSPSRCSRCPRSCSSAAATSVFSPPFC